MTDRELDGILREALVLLNTPEYLELPDEPFPTSEAFEQKMTRLCADPEKYLKKLRRAARPLWRKVLSAAAAVLLALSLSLAGVMTVSPTARAWVEKVVIQWMEEYVGFRFHGDQEQNSGIWRPTWLPEGTREVSIDDWEDGYGTVTYKDISGAYIYFDYRPVVGGNQFNIDREHSQIQEIKINGRMANQFIANIYGENSYLIWTNSDKTMAFMLMWDVSVEDMIKIAESVEQKV